VQRWHPNRRLKTHKRHINRFVHLGPPIALSLGFVLLIALGMLLLKLPVATVEPISWLESLFTATSAVTVTGLVVVDTGSQFTVLGQFFISLMMQLGGLGFMTFSVVTLIAVGSKLGLYHQTAAKEAFGATNFTTLKSTAKSVLIFSLSVELVGFLILWLHWMPELGYLDAAWQSFFYTLSAFNNAGFAIHSDSLSGYVDNPLVNIVIAGLFMSGGLGFTVWRELYFTRRWQKLSVYSKLMILGTLVINAVAILVIYLIENNNPNTLGALDAGSKWLASFFQAVTTRTAGFNTIAIDQLEDATTTLMLLLMFIGGGSLSTASGIKLVTFIILLMAAYSFLRRDGNLIIFNREIERKTVRKAFALVVIAAALNWLAIFCLALTESASFIDIVFETTSALATVGLSRGLTSELSTTGQFIIIALMFMGRLGPLTLAYILASPKTTRLRYPKAQIAIG
jgi:trk system potassium uptake protein TrkH